MEIEVKTVVDGNGWRREGQFEGFTKLDEIEWSNESYEFNITGVWVRDSDGTLWFADDSGCSCPIPWESTNTLERLFNLDPLVEFFDKYHESVQLDEWKEFKANVEEALAKLKS